MDIEETFELLEQGDKEIVLDNNHRDNIIVLGNTGAGKSTLVLLVAANNSRLIAEETTPGSGDYIIIDNDKIGNNTQQSKTLFPDLVVDPVSNVGYYDCPGFLDTRDSSHDIAATYFIKKVIDFSQMVKLLFVVNYSSVKIGNDRQDFPTLVRHIVTLVKDVTKYSEGISLVATKVENKIIFNPETGQYEMVSDAVVIQTIAAFLKEFKGSLESAAVYPDDPVLRQKALKFVNILLYQQNDTYPKLGIFRQPDRPGPLSEIPLLQENKKKLQHLFLVSSIFIAKNDDDFGYTISDRTQSSVYELVQEINRRITQVSVEIGEEIKKYYENVIKSSKDTYKLQTILEMGNDVWFEFFDNASKITSLQEYINEIRENSFKTGIPISDDTFEYLEDQNNYFIFFEEVSGKKHEILPLNWANGIKDSVMFLQRSTYWYSFLINLYDKLSTFNFQEDPNLYNVADVNNWGKPGNTQGIRITNDNVHTFLGKLEKENINGYNDVKDLKSFSQFELRDLNNVLDVTLVQRPSFDCRYGDKLVVKGNFVKLTDTSKTSCVNINKLEVFALNTFFVDGNLDKRGHKFQIGIIAPTWQITKDAKIAMEGKPGDRQSDVGKSTSPGGKGQDGGPGHPGIGGGAFFGVGKTFIAGRKLTIDTSGGTGGDGQTGGDGGNGNRGADPYLPPPRYWPGTNFKFYVVGDLKFRYKYTGYHSYTNKFGTFIESYYDVYGDKANGGDGGDGGVRGLGGNNGNIKIIEMERLSEIWMISNKGVQGNGGNGGKGGNPGRDGDTLKTTLFSSNLFPNSDWKVNNRYAGSTSDSGKVGIGDKNDKGLKQPDPPVTYNNPSALTADYKSYLKTNLNNPIQKQSLNEFLKDLEGNNEIKQLYGFSGLTNDLLNSENTLTEVNNTNFVNISEDFQIRRNRGIRSTPTENKFVYSSSTKSSSPINDFFKWFKTTTDNVVKNIGGWFSNVPLLSGPENNFSNFGVSYSYDFNSSLLLADLLVRKLNNQKSFIPKESSLSINEVQGLVLEIMTLFEEELERLGFSIDLDPVSVQHKLMFLISNENYSRISETLCKFVELDYENECKITTKIAEMLEKEVGNLKQNSFTNQINLFSNGIVCADTANDRRFGNNIDATFNLIK